MGTEPQTKTEAANAIAILRSSFHSSTEAVSKLEQYIRHLEELLLEELGREEFERRLEHLILRDQRNEESLFIPDDHSMCRKRGSSSTEIGSSPKRARLDSLTSSLSSASGLGRSILEGGRRLHSDSPDVSRNTSCKTSVLEYAAMDAQQATTTTVKQMARRPIIAPRLKAHRASQSAMLPNKQPSSNFHSASQSVLLPNRHPSPNDHTSATLLSIIKKKEFRTILQSIETTTLKLRLRLHIFDSQHSSSLRTRLFQLDKTRRSHEACTPKQTRLPIIIIIIINTQLYFFFFFFD
ncbi:hypothetical protein KCU95_g4263, partial [Aureobasidium melanogenum]